MAANQHQPEVYSLFPGDAPECDDKAMASLMLEVSEWVAEARLLDTLLKLEHPAEHETARSQFSHEGEPGHPESPESSGDGSLIDSTGDATKAVSVGKPKPVVFDIGGQRFRVDTLKAVADALVVATTEASLNAPGGGLPYTRRDYS